MAFELLKTDYVDAVFEGLRRYMIGDNGDGTVSFIDVTNYTVREGAFFGAKDANTINTAVNAILAALNNGTDLYDVFTLFFETQKRLFEDESDAKQEGFEQYITELRTYMDGKWDELKDEYTGDIQYFKDVQENAFNVWFQMIRDQLTNDVAGHLQMQIGNLQELGTENTSNLVDAVNELNDITVKNETIGDLDTLKTSKKESIVSAVNEVKDSIAESSNTLDLKINNEVKKLKAQDLQTYEDAVGESSRRLDKFATESLRVFRGYMGGLTKEDETLNCGTYGTKTLTFYHVTVSGLEEAPKKNDIIIIHGTDEEILSGSVMGGMVIFHIGSKEYVASGDMYAALYYKNRTTPVYAQKLYNDRNLQILNKDQLTDMVIILKKRESYEYATICDYGNGDESTVFRRSVAANYEDMYNAQIKIQDLEKRVNNCGLKIIERGFLTNETICLSMEEMKSYLLFTVERKVADNTVYGYRARMYAAGPKSKAVLGANLAASSNAGVTLGTIIESQTVSGITGTGHYGITLKATAAYNVRYVLCEITGG